MKITKKWMKSKHACQEGVDWALSCKESDPTKLMKIARDSDDYEIMTFAIWGFTHLINKRNKVRFAVYCAEKVIKIFEDKYPNDKRPRKAIQAAKRFMKKPTMNNKNAAAAAADAATVAAADVYAADAAADAYAAAAAVAYAAYAVAAAYAASAAAAASAADAYAAYAAAAYATSKRELFKKFINYGIKILKESK